MTAPAQMPIDGTGMRILSPFGAALAALLLLNQGCAGAGDKEKDMASKKGKTVPFIQIDPGPFYDGAEPDAGVIPMESSLHGPYIIRIRSLEGWRRFGYINPLPISPGLEKDDPGRDPGFADHEVFWVTMGVQGTTGYSMKLDRIDHKDGTLRFFITTGSPGRMDPVGEALTRPAVLVRTAKLDKELRPEMIMDGKITQFELKVLE